MKRVSQNERKSKKKRRESIPLTIAQKKIIYGIRSIQEEAQEQKVG